MNYELLIFFLFRKILALFFKIFSVVFVSNRCAPGWQSNNYVVYTMYWLIVGFLLPLGFILLSSCKIVIHLVKVCFMHCAIQPADSL